MHDPRIRRELKTVEVMVDLYCHGQHGTSRGRCAECEALLAYARQRVKTCPFQGEKPTCAQCTIHCYNKAMRAKIRQVMRYAGPRMVYTHPVLAILHLVDKFKTVFT